MNYTVYFCGILTGVYIDQNYKIPNIMDTFRTIEKQFSKK